MSNEPKQHEDMFDPDLFEDPGSLPLSRQAAGETGVMFAAFARMQAAIRGEDGTRGRLRNDLRAMAQTLAEARHEIAAAMAAGVGLDHTTAADALLEQLETRVGRMLGLADATDPPADSETHLSIADEEPAHPDARARRQPEDLSPAEPEEVPTVSRVVSDLGRAVDAHVSVPHDRLPVAPTVDAPAVARLASMVEALTASPPPPERVAPAPQMHALPPAPIMPEVDLLSNFARMEAIPFLPVEVGTAVIFQPRHAAQADDTVPAEPQHAVAAPPETSADRIASRPDVSENA